MKKITKQFLFCALSLSALTFVSCSTDDATGASTLEVATGVIGTVNFATPIVGMQTINEGNDLSYDYTITLNKPQSVDIHFKIEKIAGTATSDDYIAEEVVIPAYATTASGNISIVNDCEIEGTETLTLQMFDVTTSNASVAPVTLSFTINNYLSNSLDLTFNYNKSFSLFGTATTLYSFSYDLDFYLVDSSDNVVSTDAAQLGNASEKLSMMLDPLNLPDGNYRIYYDIYDTGDLNGTAAGSPGLENFYHDPFDIPITVDYERCGGINPGNFAQEIEFAPDTTFSNGDQNPNTDSTGNTNFVMQIEVMNGIFTLSNSLPVAFASGRHANNVAAAIAQARRTIRK